MERRQVLKGIALSAITSAGLGLGIDLANAGPQDVAAIIKKLAGARGAQSGRITLKTPEIAENGKTVPVSVVVDSPMSKTDYVQSLHLLAEGNPLPQIITMNFGPETGGAMLQTRMRLGKTQNVVAVAVMNNGQVFTTSRKVKVTIGGCGG